MRKRSKPTNIRRLKWLLVQQDVTGRYYVTNNEILDHHIVVNQHIDFNVLNKIYSGIVIDVNENKHIIDRKFKSLPKNSLIINEEDPENENVNILNINRTENNINKPNCWFIVQYSTNINEIIYSVVNYYDVEEKHFQELGFNNIYILDGIKRLASVLYINEDESLVMNEFRRLRRFTFDTYMKEYKYNQVYQAFLSSREINFNLTKSWFLIQYAKNQKTLVYTVIREVDTIWKIENLASKNLAIYFAKELTIYQGIVLKESNESEDLHKELINIIQKLHFPIEPIPGTSFQKNFLRDILNNVETIEIDQIKKKWLIDYKFYSHHSGEVIQIKKRRRYSNPDYGLRIHNVNDLEHIFVGYDMAKFLNKARNRKDN